MAGAVVGGAGGSVAGPVAGGLGAGAGWTVGELAKGDAELKEAQETITALTQGDVKTLVEKGLSEQKGWMETLIEGLYDTLLLCGIGIGLYLLVPVLYSRYLHKKTTEHISQNGQK